MARARLSGAAMTCILDSFKDPAALEQKAERSALGVARLSVTPADVASGERPQATVMLGYRESPPRAARSWSERPAPPQPRRRAHRAAARDANPPKAGRHRGPRNDPRPRLRGQLPEELWLYGRASSIKGLVDKETKTAKFALPADAKGFYQVSWSSGRALIFVRSDDELRLSLKPDRARSLRAMRPPWPFGPSAKDMASQRRSGCSASIESLAQLASLPGPGELEQLRPRVETPSPAFGVLDGQALAMGRIPRRERGTGGDDAGHRSTRGARL